MYPDEITEQNIKQKAEQLLEQYRKKSQLYGSRDNHDVILVPLGNDFYYDNEETARPQFENYEKLINYLNSRSDLNVNVKFGTLSEYFNLMKQSNHRANKKIETFSGDFFTYADKSDNYWSGYFTSRPFQKHLDRIVESYLRSAEIIYSLAKMANQSKLDHNFDNSKQLYLKLSNARNNLGLFQHHDGITGTSKTYVVRDYETKLLKSISNSMEIIEESASYLLKNSSNSNLMLKIDDIAASDTLINLNEYNPKFTLFIYNSNLNKRFEIVKLKVNDPNVEVLNSKGDILKNIQLSLIWPKMDDTYIHRENEFPYFYYPNMNPELEFDNRYFELLFQVEIDPLSIESFTIRKKRDSESLIDNLSETVFYKKNFNPLSENNIRIEIANRYFY